MGMAGGMAMGGGAGFGRSGAFTSELDERPNTKKPSPTTLCCKRTPLAGGIMVAGLLKVEYGRRNERWWLLKK